MRVLEVTWNPVFVRLELDDADFIEAVDDNLGEDDDEEEVTGGRRGGAREGDLREEW